jgi:hypothetical protein
VNRPAATGEPSDRHPIAWKDFLARHGAWPAAIARLPGGANNAVYRVEAPAGAFLLKHYFVHPDDDRDRFDAEVAFSRFAWNYGIRALPQLLGSCRNERLALFEFVTGRAVASEEIDPSVIGQALRFCRHLQDARTQPEAAALPLAAESCFSIRQHLACVDRRLGNLQGIQPDSALGDEALSFVRGELRGRWTTVRAQVRQRCSDLGIAEEEELRVSERVLSPSDFGFHNALRDDSGCVRFFDFEYAGWDDPAKLVCDFFWQVQVPVPRAFLPAFAEGVAEGLPAPQRIVQRIDLLLPVYQIKWCCIVLNEFLPQAQVRRRFSSADQRPDRRPERQLQKARKLLDEPARWR